MKAQTGRTFRPGLNLAVCRAHELVQRAWWQRSPLSRD